MGPTAEIEAACSTSAVLRPLSSASVRRLSAAGAPVDLAPGALLFQAGDPGDAVYVVLSGEVEVRTLSAGGRDLRHGAIGPGSVVGEMACLDGGTRSADVVCSRRARLWRMPASALLEVLGSDAAAAVALTIELSRRLRAANAELQAATSLDLAGRLARLLVMGQDARALVSITQTEMARRIGASREKVNRRLHAWAAEGVVRIEAAGVRLIEAGRLAALFSA